MSHSKYTTWTFIILLLISFGLVVHLLFGFITSMIMSFVIVSLFSPIQNWLLKIFPKKPYLAAFLSTLLVFLCVLIPIGVFIVLLTKQALTIYQASAKFSGSEEFSVWLHTLKGSLENWHIFLKDLGIGFSLEKLLSSATDLVNSIGKNAYEYLSLIASNVFSVLLNFILTLMLVFVFFLSGSSIKKFSMDLIPLPNEEKNRLIQKFAELSEAIFIGNGLVSIIEGVIGGFLFWMFNIPGALIWGVAISIAAFLPMVGASVVIIPAGIFLFLKMGILPTIIFVLLNALQITVFEILVKPKLIGTKTHMHAVLVFLAVVAGIQVYGIFGLFYGPLLITIFISLAQIYQEHYRAKLLQNNSK